VTPELREATREMTGYWWLWLNGGIAWIVVSLVILQFASASITTVGVLVGLMLALASIQSFALTTAGGAWPGSRLRRHLGADGRHQRRRAGVRDGGLHEEVSGGTATEGSPT
jgi:hypothetical protein